MHPESAIIERVEILIRHPVFEGSAGVMEDVLSDLGSLASSRQIGHEAYRRLREMILRSPHIAYVADRHLRERRLACREGLPPQI